MKNNKKKLLMFGVLGMFAISLVVAGYIVNSFVLTTDVYEPFTVEYAILGDAGNWNGIDTCAEYYANAGIWFPGTDIDVVGLYAGEQRKVCVKITNTGEGDIHYDVTGEVLTGYGNYAECESAFGNPSISGVALGSSVTIDGIAVVVAEDAEPSTDCQIRISTTRG